MNKKGFTLIELLIVVAIIAILAAIAVPNFLEAQTRAKVSRCKADLRSAATALEAYYIDYNKYPSPYEQHAQIPWTTSIAPGYAPPFHARQPSILTTPVAYITSLPADPFRSTKVVLTGFLAPFNSRYTYFNFQFLRAVHPTAFVTLTSSTFSRAEALAGSWLFYGVGPDVDEWNRVNISDTQLSQKVYIDYDPTNGTTSRGNVFRTQASGERLGVDPFFN